MDLCNRFTHIPQGYFTGIFPQFQRSMADEYEYAYDIYRDA